MGGISVGGGHGGKKNVDSQLPLVPFIDLLLCCVMFLLVTAVWNEIASLNATLPGTGNPDAPATDRTSNALLLHVAAGAYVVSTTSGIHEVIERHRDAAERAEL